MKTEKLIIIIGIIILIVSLVIVNVIAFNTVESKVLKAMDEKCPTSLQIINNITNITQRITTPEVQQPVQPTNPIILNEREEDD